jgi:hypothetical protein
MGHGNDKCSTGNMQQKGTCSSEKPKETTGSCGSQQPMKTTGGSCSTSGKKDDKDGKTGSCH